jgi:hypothetical protein
MRRFLLTSIIILMTVSGASSQSTPDAIELTKLLNDFLAGASTNDVAMHDRFWADDLIYTRSAGRRVTKVDVMRDVRNSPAPKPSDPRTVFTAEDIRIQQYGSTAVVAFRLVSTTDANGTKQLSNNLNSGTFVKRDGKWQVVSWQSTRMPRSPEENSRDLTAAEAAFQKAVLTADTRALILLMDSAFIWTQGDGTQLTRKQLIDDLGAGRLKYGKLETSNVTVSVFGDTGVVRGETLRQRTSIPTTPSTADGQPFKAFYTMTFINQGGAWRAVSMHSSRTQ